MEVGPFFCFCTDKFDFRKGLLDHAKDDHASVVYKVCSKPKCQYAVYQGENHKHAFAKDKHGGGENSAANNGGVSGSGKKANKGGQRGSGAAARGGGRGGGWYGLNGNKAARGRY